MIVAMLEGLMTINIFFMPFLPNFQSGLILLMSQVDFNSIFAPAPQAYPGGKGGGVPNRPKGPTGLRLAGKGDSCVKR